MKQISREDLEKMYPTGRDLTEQEIKMYKMPVAGNKKFTPGPWKLQIFASDDHLYVHKNGTWIAEIRNNVEENMPDAHLIASAPDLYEALRCFATGEGLPPGQTIEGILAKARGGS